MEILRASNQEEVRNDKDTQKLMSYYNKEMSDELKALPKYQAFELWCQ